MKVCFIGNGSTNTLFDRNVIKYNFTVCCNIPQHGYKWDFISIIDPQPIKIIESKKLNLGTIWCPPDTKRIADIKNFLVIGWESIKENLGTILDYSQSILFARLIRS